MGIDLLCTICGAATRDEETAERGARPLSESGDRARESMA